jgi:AcrR family transcriptional regulator
MRRTKEEAEGSKKTIIDAAYKIFLDKGYAATNLDDIAKNIKMTRGVIYWHFKSKLDLFVCLLNEAIDESFTNAQKIYQSSDPLSEKLKRILVSDESGSRLFELLKAFHPGSKDIDSKTRNAALKSIMKKVQIGFDTFAEFLVNEQRAGRLRIDVDIQAFVAMFFMIGGIVNAPSHSDAKIPLISLCSIKRDAIVNLLWNGLNSVLEK